LRLIYLINIDVDVKTNLSPRNQVIVALANMPVMNEASLLAAGAVVAEAFRYLALVNTL
jgi:hypothetical protein